MSIEKITGAIISDANDEAKRILEEAEAKAAALIEEAKEKAENIIARAESDGQIEKEKLIDRRKSVSEIDGKKKVLAKKQAEMDSCFAEAIDAVANLPEEKYMDFLLGLLKATGETRGEVILNAKDREALGRDFCQRACEEVAGGEFALADEVGDFVGGFILRRGKVFVKATLEELVNNSREAMAHEVASRLFL